MKLRVAGVGAGYFAQFHYEAWKRIEEIELVGVCDLDSEKAEQTALIHNIPEVCSEFDRLCKKTNPGLVDIITPPNSHKKLVEKAFRYRIPVICQKPLAPDLKTANEMVSLAEKNDMFFAVHENFRFQPWFQEIKIILENQLLGKIYSLSFRLRPGDGQGEEAYLKRQPYFQKMERFLVHETGIHFIDTFRFLLGEIKGVYADLRKLNPNISGEDTGTIIFDFLSGERALFDANRLVDHPAENTRLTMGEMMIEGSDSILRLDGFGRIFIRAHHQDEIQHQYNWFNRGFAGDSVFALQNHLIECLLAGKETPMLAKNYLRNMVIEDEIYRSNLTQSRIEC